MMTSDLTAVANGRSVYTQLELQFERLHGNTLWVKMRRDPVQAVLNYSFSLLREMHDMVTSVREANAHWTHDGMLLPIEYAVMRSDHPDYFNLGGDLRSPKSTACSVFPRSCSGCFHSPGPCNCFPAMSACARPSA